MRASRDALWPNCHAPRGARSISDANELAIALCSQHLVSIHGHRFVCTLSYVYRSPTVDSNPFSFETVSLLPQ